MRMQSIESPKDFGQVVRRARQERGLTQAELARMCGCSQRFVSEVERGKATAELGKCLQLLRVLEVPLHAGTDSLSVDGRAQVYYAVTRIASDLESNREKQPRLKDILKEEA